MPQKAAVAEKTHIHRAAVCAHLWDHHHAPKRRMETSDILHDTKPEKTHDIHLPTQIYHQNYSTKDFLQFTLPKFPLSL